MSTKAEPGPFDGLERAKPDEPIFTLKAGDPQAADLVRQWVYDRRQTIIHADLTDEVREVELLQAREAEKVAEAMEDWRAGTVTIAEPEHPISYVGTKMSANELAAKQRFDTIKEASARLHNSVAEIAEAGELIRELDPYNAQLCADASDAVKAIAMTIQPKRASYAHRASEVAA